MNTPAAVWKGFMAACAAALALACFCAAPARADGPGTAGAAFLKVGMGARAAALGDSGAAARGLEAVFWNPAGLARTSGAEAQFTWLDWLEDATFSDTALALRAGGGTAALWLRRVSQPPLAGYNAAGDATGEYEAADSAVSAVWARSYGRWALGAAGRLVFSRIADESAFTGAVDLGFQYDITPRLTLGYALCNLGPGLKFIDERDPLPQVSRLGGSWLFARGSAGALALSLDAERQLDRRTDLHGGVEYAARAYKGVRLFLRGGYRTRVEGFSAKDGFTAGLGAAAGAFSLDYAYSPYGDLGAANRVSLSWNFGRGPAGKPAE